MNLVVGEMEKKRAGDLKKENLIGGGGGTGLGGECLMTNSDVLLYFLRQHNRLRLSPGALRYGQDYSLFYFNPAGLRSSRPYVSVQVRTRPPSISPAACPD